MPPYVVASQLTIVACCGLRSNASNLGNPGSNPGKTISFALFSSEWQQIIFLLQLRIYDLKSLLCRLRPHGLHCVRDITFAKAFVLSAVVETMLRGAKTTSISTFDMISRRQDFFFLPASQVVRCYQAALELDVTFYVPLAEHTPISNRRAVTTASHSSAIEPETRVALSEKDAARLPDREPGDTERNTGCTVGYYPWIQTTIQPLAINADDREGTWKDLAHIDNEFRDRDG